MLTRNSLRTKVLLVLGILIILNLIASRFFLRADFTGDKRYTLSKATKNILNELDEAVTVTAYFSEDLPPQIDKVRRDFQDLLTEYENRSGGNVVYEFINPNESEEKEREVMGQGIQPQVIQVRERDQSMQKRVYLGAKLQYGEQEEIIPVIQPGAAMEYSLSTSIKKMSATNKPTIGFISGHGETSLAAMQQVQESLSILYNTKAVQLSDSALLTAYEALILVSPTDSFKQGELSQLDAFLGTGKGVLIAMNRVNANLQTGQATAISTGLESWLASKGISVNEDLIIDAKCGAVTVQQQQGFFMFNQQVPFPYLPILQNFADHPVTKGLEQVILPFASSISYTETTPGLTYTPVAFSSQQSGTEQPPMQLDAQKKLPDYDFYTSKLTAGATLEGNFSGNVPARLVLFSDSDFATNGEGQQAQRLQPDNINMFVNGVDWLADDTGLNDLRTKGISSRPIRDDISEGQKLFIKWGNFLAPILLILLYGFFRSQSRKRKKKQWASQRWN